MTDAAVAELEAACHHPLHDHFVEGKTDSLDTGQLLLGAMGAAFLDMEVSLGLLERVVQRQRADGQIARRPGEDGAAAPLAASVLRLAFFTIELHRKDLRARVAALVEAIDRHHAHLFARERSRLLRSRAGDERLFPAPAPLRDGVADVALNSVLVQAETDLGDLVVNSGKPAQEIMLRRARRAQATLARLWNDQLLCFSSRVGGQWDVPQTAGGLLPLYAGAALPEQARAMRELYVSDGRGYWSTTPLSTLAMDHPGYDPARPGWGAVDPVLNWLMVHGLHRYGWEDQARELARGTLECVRRFGPYDAYHALHGHGVAGEGSPRAAAVALMLLRAAPWDRAPSLF